MSQNPCTRFSAGSQKIKLVHLMALNAIWEADKRLPTLSSRREWSLSRGIKPSLVNQYFWRQRARARKGKSRFYVPDDSDNYDLPVGTPEQEEATPEPHVKQEEEEPSPEPARRIKRLHSIPDRSSSSPCAYTDHPSSPSSYGFGLSTSSDTARSSPAPFDEPIRAYIPQTPKSTAHTSSNLEDKTQEPSSSDSKPTELGFRAPRSIKKPVYALIPEPGNFLCAEAVDGSPTRFCDFCSASKDTKTGQLHNPNSIHRCAEHSMQLHSRTTTPWYYQSNSTPNIVLCLLHTRLTSSLTLSLPNPVFDFPPVSCPLMTLEPSSGSSRLSLSKPVVPITSTLPYALTALSLNAHSCSMITRIRQTVSASAHATRLTRNAIFAHRLTTSLCTLTTVMRLTN